MRKRRSKKSQTLVTTIEGWKKDFVTFTRLLDVVDKRNERIPVQQSPILAAWEKERSGRDYILKPRQVYMTTWELARDIWFFMVNPNAKVVILCQSSNTNDATKELSARIVTLLEGLRRNCPDAPFAKISDTRWVRTDGGTAELKIVGAGATEKAAGKKGRSGTIHRLHVTEVAFFEFAFDTLTAILACVPPDSSVTEIVFESTPKGAAGAFFEGYMAAKEGRTEYKANFFPWFNQPEYRAELKEGEVVLPRTEREKQLVAQHGITPEQLKWYQQKVADPLGGQAKVDQEFPSDEETCWLFDGRLFFDKDALHRLRSLACPAPHRLFAGACQIWQRPENGKTYIVSIDPSSGQEQDEEEARKKKLDPSAIIVLERETGVHCATLHGYFHPDILGDHAARLAWLYNIATIVVERSSSHGAIHSVLTKWERPSKDGVGYPNIFYDADRSPGFKVTPASRPAILDGLEIAIRNGEFKTHDIDIIKEAQLFVVKDEKPGAASGAHDDRIMATAIAWKLIQIPVGLNYSQFAQPPSIAFEKTPASFEGLTSIHQSINSLVESEQRKWANADGGNGGWVVHLNRDMDGF